MNGGFILRQVAPPHSLENGFYGDAINVWWFYSPPGTKTIREVPPLVWVLWSIFLRGGYCWYTLK